MFLVSFHFFRTFLAQEKKVFSRSIWQDSSLDILCAERREITTDKKYFRQQKDIIQNIFIVRVSRVFGESQEAKLSSLSRVERKDRFSDVWNVFQRSLKHYATGWNLLFRNFHPSLSCTHDDWKMMIFHPCAPQQAPILRPHLKCSDCCGIKVSTVEAENFSQVFASTYQ